MAPVAAPNPRVGCGRWMSGSGKLAGDMRRGDSKSFGREGEAGHSSHFNISVPAIMQLRASMFVLWYG